MSRFINADELLHKLPDDLPYKASVKRVLMQAPTADAVEVRHGEWKKASDKAPRYVCAACNHLFNNKEYKYCPFCGAKMDGKKEDTI